jgi:hypothetical protein
MSLHAIPAKKTDRQIQNIYTLFFFQLSRVPSDLEQTLLQERFAITSLQHAARGDRWRVTMAFIPTGFLRRTFAKSRPHPQDLPICHPQVAKKGAGKRPFFVGSGFVGSGGSALAELEAPAGLRLAVLLAFHRARIAGQESRDLQDTAQIRLIVGQCPADAMADGAGLTR